MTSTYFLLWPAFDSNGDPVFLPLSMLNEDIKPFIEWRKNRKSEGGPKPLMRYQWVKSEGGDVCDLPPSGEAGGIWSDLAVNALREFMVSSGELFPVDVEGRDGYSLFLCSSLLKGQMNESYRFWNPLSLSRIELNTPISLPPAFLVAHVAPLIVSAEFKSAAESAGLTGMVFHPVEVLFG